MRDGVRLEAEIFTPPNTLGPLPILLHLTPYDERVKASRTVGKFFSEQGYVCVNVSCRGCGLSEGKLELFAGDGQDGFDCIEWLADQPWCDGQVAMWGGSYCGFTQWATAAQSPPHLKTIAPVAAVGGVHDYPTTNGILMSHLAFYCNFVDREATQCESVDGQPFSWREVYYKRFMEHLPFASLDSLAGCASEQFQTIVQHPTLDAYWDSILPTEADYRKIDIPILTITGHYDGDQRGALMYYKNHHAFGIKDALQQHYLVFGPWNHGGTCVQPHRELAGLDFGQSSVIDMPELHLRWYDWVLKGKEKPSFLKKRVVYFVEDENSWKSADDVGDISTDLAKYYLTSQGGEPTLARPGLLSLTIPKTPETAEFVYDPLDTSPAEFERATETIYHSDASHAGRFLVDQDSVLSHTLKQNGLVYESQPLENDIEIAGYLRFVVWISMDVPDTDFQVCVYELTSDGRCIILTDSMMRARYRDSLKKQSLVAEGETNRYEFDQFQFFSRRIRQGSHLRLVFRCVNSIYWQKNYNSGKVVATETAQDARTAHVTVHQNAEQASFLEIPIA